MHAFTKLDQENLSSRGIQVHPCPFNADSHVTAENVETNFYNFNATKNDGKIAYRLAYLVLVWTNYSTWKQTC